MEEQGLKWCLKLFWLPTYYILLPQNRHNKLDSRHYCRLVTRHIVMVMMKLMNVVLRLNWSGKIVVVRLVLRGLTRNTRDSYLLLSLMWLQLLRYVCLLIGLRVPLTLDLRRWNRHYLQM